MEKHSSVWAYLTSMGIALFGGVTLQDAVLLVGVLTTLGTFLVNWYYKAREDARAAKRHGDLAEKRHGS